MKVITSVKQYMYLIKPYFTYGKFYLFGSVLLITCISPINTYISVFLQQFVIDSISANESFIQILCVIGGFQALLVITSISNEVWFRLYGERKFVQISAALNREIMEKILHVDYKHFDDPVYYNAYTWAAREYAGKVEGARQVLTSMCSSVFTVTTLVTYISISNPVVLVATVLILIITLGFNTWITRLNIEKQEQIMDDDRKIGYVQGTFNAKERIGDLFSTHISSYLFRMYDAANHSKAQKIQKTNRKILLLNAASTLCLGGLNVFVMAFLTWKIMNGQVSLGGFVGMLTASGHLRGNLQKIFKGYKKIHEFAVYAEKIRQFMNIQSTIECEPTLHQKEHADMLQNTPYQVEIRNLSFSYPNSRFALRDINLLVRKGEKVAIVGENGVGKTTLSKLLLRLYDPDRGSILYNDVNVHDLPIKALRLKIGVAFQQPGIYALPFIENMKLYEQEANEQNIEDIITMFGFQNVLDKNGADIYTELTKQFNKDGIVLSGGETQRLALARLFTKQFGLLILDEASSALDPIAEYELNKTLFALSNGTTTIMIAHRLSTIRDVDRIYVLHKGMVVECGNHEQLIEKKGIYYNMFTKQAENYRR